MAEFDILDQTTPPKETASEDEEIKQISYISKISYPEDNEENIYKKSWKQFASSGLKERNEKFPVYPMWEIINGNFGMDTKGFTITFKQIYRDIKTEKELKRLVKDSIQLFVKETGCKDKIKLILIGEYDTKANFHFHGVIHGLKPRQLAHLRVRFNKYIGFCKIENDIKNYYDWLNYILKDFDDETATIMTRNIVMVPSCEWQPRYK